MAAALWLGVAAPASATKRDAADADSLYSFVIERGWLRMPDGVRLSVTYFRPTPRHSGERFPALLELLPYRKDDSFYRRDYPLYSYFVRRGYILAKVDIRGTGGSEGKLPDREYSDAELADAVEIIRQLAHIPRASGAVGMWGISWGAFNALQVAAKRPPELKAIIALHASDDLYHDDIRYIDGALHIDPYDLQIDHENGLPRTPDYRLDADYFRNRFDQPPWILTYLRHPVNDSWWRSHSVRYDYGAIQVPAYLVAGLLDGYRDAEVRLLEHLPGPSRLEIGPWNHAWPDNGTPGPTYGWRARAIQWWDHWLKGKDSPLLHEPRFIYFMRDAHKPDANLQMTPGQWRGGDWPITDSRVLTMYPGANGTLERAATTPGVDLLRYVPSSGTTAGDWWGEPTGDMRRDDTGALVYDSDVLTDTSLVAGFPEVRLRASVDATLANWTVRLEDVHPDGIVSLVAGGVLNGTQRDDPESPQPLVPGREYDLRVPMHFTTWTFRPGHRIRLAISNAQFPMIWPSPSMMTMRLARGGDLTSVSIPVIPVDPSGPPTLQPSEAWEQRPGTSERPGAEENHIRITYDAASESTTVSFKTGYAFGLEAGRVVTVRELESYMTRDSDPARSGFIGDEEHDIQLRGRRLKLFTHIDVRSTSTELIASVERRLTENGKLVRRRAWKETFARKVH
jgi:predicted acyl esterase